MGPYVNPTVPQFQSQFQRDFPYGTTMQYVQFSDIQSAFTDAGNFINPIFFQNQSQYTVYFNILAAHFLVLNLRASSQGISGTWPWMTTSKSVGSVSEGLAIPDRIMNNPELAMLTKTYYGAKYLMFVLPQLTGQMYAVCSQPNP